jgi:hypothetical protein
MPDENAVLTIERKEDCDKLGSGKTSIEEVVKSDAPKVKDVERL